MPSQLVVIGDVHLHPGAKNEQRLRSLDQIIRGGLTLPRLGAWVFTGDLFHAKSTIEDRNALVSIVQRMASTAPVIIPYGNHDVDGDLDVFERLEAAYPIVVFKAPNSHRLELATGEWATVGVLPYPHKAMLAAMGIAPADVLQAADGALHDILTALGQELAEARAEGDHVFFVGHANISGAVASNGQPSIGREISLTGAHLERLGAMPKLFGHIHKPQEVHGAIYAGSIARLDWGETEAKRYLVLALADDGTYRVSSRPLDCPAMYHVEGLLTRDGFTYSVTNGPGGELQLPPETWREAEVRVRYRFAQSEKAALDVEQVREPFAEAGRLVLEPIAVPDRALRAPAVVAARTLPEKVEAWAQHVGVVASDTVLAKLARLEQSDPLALVREVEGWLRELETLEDKAVVA